MSASIGVDFFQKILWGMSDPHKYFGTKSLSANFFYLANFEFYRSLSEYCYLKKLCVHSKNGGKIQ